MIDRLAMKQNVPDSFHNNYEICAELLPIDLYEIKSTFILSL